MNISGLTAQVKEFVSGLPGKPNASFVSSAAAEKRSRVFGIPVRTGGINFSSFQKVPSTAQTVYIDAGGENNAFATQKKKDIGASLERTLQELFAYLSACPLIYSDGSLGKGSGFSASCRLFVSSYRPESVHLCHMFSLMTFPGKGAPDLTVICIPEWSEKDRQVLVFSGIGVTFILGSDYFGEVRSAFLRMALSLSPDPGLHASAKIMTVEDAEGALKKIGIVFFGISPTGKTTHACHDHGFRRHNEKMHILQDDLLFWQKDGMMAGAENGFYIRTDRLGPISQPVLWKAANSPGAVLENVVVDYQGRPLFEDKTVAACGHGVIPFDVLSGPEGGGINMPPPRELDRMIFFFMTKNFTVVPVLSRLNREQAAVCYMLTEPFDAVGSEIGKLDGRGGVSAVEVGRGNAKNDVDEFYARLTEYPGIECYLLNIGGVGELVDTGLDGGRRILQKVDRFSVSEISIVLRSVLRGTVKWTDDKNWMCRVPSSIEGLDVSRFDLYSYYDQSRIDMLVYAVRSERRAFAARFEGIDKKIIDSIEG